MLYYFLFDIPTTYANSRSILRTLPPFMGRGREEKRGEEKRGEERRREERGEEGVGRGFQEGTVSMPHAACPGAQASPPASNDALSPGSMLLVRVRRRPRLLSRRCCLQKTQGRRQEGDSEPRVVHPKKSGTSRLRSVCNKRRAPSFTLRYPSSPNPPRQTPRYSRTHSRTYPADLPMSQSPYAATPAHYPSPAAQA